MSYDHRRGAAHPVPGHGRNCSGTEAKLKAQTQTHDSPSPQKKKKRFKNQTLTKRSCHLFTSCSERFQRGGEKWEISRLRLHAGVDNPSTDELNAVIAVRLCRMRVYIIHLATAEGERGSAQPQPPTTGNQNVVKRHSEERQSWF